MEKIMGRRSQPLIPRLLSHVNKTGFCWEWLGATDKDGYGKTSIMHNSVVAHRAIYEALVGPIPKGKELDHLCKNPSCVNPSHLEIVTRKENAWRNSLCKITFEDAEVIRRRYKAGERQTSIAKDYNMRQDNISRIINNKHWNIT
jgi:hypothetical protein